MIVSPNRFLSLLLFTTLVQAVPYTAAYGQEQSAQETIAEKPDQDRAENSDVDLAEPVSTDEKAAARAKKLRRWYLGARPQLPGQLGPSGGVPKNVIPQPFLPLNDLKKVLLEEEATPVDGPDLVESESGTDPLQPNFIDSEGQESSESGLLPDTVADTGSDTFTGFAQTDLQETDLALPDPSLEGLVDGIDETVADIYAGQLRADVLASLTGLANRSADKSLSPVLDDFLRRLLRAPLPIEGSEAVSDIAALLTARLSLAESLGDADAYSAIIALFEDERLADSFARLRADHVVLIGDLGGACTLASERRTSDSDPFWLRIGAVCAAIAGNRTDVDFQLSLLEEISDIEDAFYGLTNRILLEAEGAASGNAAGTLDQIILNDFEPSPLNIAMARLTNALIDSVRLSKARPLEVLQALKLPSLSDAARADLVGLAIERGQIDPGEIVSFFRQSAYDLNDAVEGASIEDFTVDAALGHAAVSGEDEAVRLDAAARLWQRSRERGTEALMALALSTGLQDIEPKASLGFRLAPLFRVAVLAQDNEKAAAIFTTMRTLSRGNDLLADQALLLAVPVAVAAGMAEPSLLTKARLEDSIEVNGAAKTILLLSMLEGLDIAEVTDDQWDTVVGIERLETTVVNPVIWRRYLQAVETGDPVTVLSALPMALSALQSGGADPAFTGSMAAGLKAVGLDELSNQLMREYLYAQGF